MLKRKEKDAVWQSLFKVLRPGQSKFPMVIPDQDSFDPDTYGMVVEQAQAGKCKRVGTV